MGGTRRGFGRGVLTLTLLAATLAGSPVVASAQIDALPPTVLPTGIVINIPQRLLFVMRDGQVVARYPVGLGRRTWPTFVGPFTIVSKEVDPTWDVPPSIQEELRRAGKPVVTRVAPGPDNPLGKYWLGLSVAGYGIHGTNAPASIAKFQTHGCIRMRADDIASLFGQVTVGTPGLVVYEPVLIRVVDGRLWLEVHPDAYRRDRRDLPGVVAIEAARLAPEARIDWAIVGRTLSERAGRAVAIGPAR